MIVNCWRRVHIFELPTARQICSNGSPRLLEKVLDGLCHSLSVDLSNTAWAQRRLINKLSGNTFRTEPSDSVKIDAVPSYGTIFGTMPKIRAQMVQTMVLYLALLPGFKPENPRYSLMHDSTLKPQGAAINRLRPWKPMAKRWYYIWFCAKILSISFVTGTWTKL